MYQTLLKQIGLEVPGEQLATILQDLNKWAVLNPEKPFSAYIDERPSAALQTLVATVIGVGGNVAVVKGVDKALQALSPDYKAENDALALQQLMETAMQSKLRERDPEQFRSALGEMLQKTGQETVHIDAEVLAQMPPDVLAQLSGAAEQLEGALASNSTVELKIADVLTVAPGSGTEQTLLDNIRMSPEAATRLEDKQAGEEAEQLLAQRTEAVIQQATDAASAMTAAENIKQTILQELNAAGRFSPAVNDLKATLMRDFFVAMGARSGATPEQLFTAMRPTTQGALRAPETPATKAVRESMALRGVIGDGTLVNLQRELAKYTKDEEKELLDAETRAKAEGMLAPRVTLATEAKPAFDAAVNQIAQSLGGQAKIPGIKGIGRAAEKLVLESENDISRIMDLVRATVVVNHIDEVPAAIEAVSGAFEVVRIKNRFEKPMSSGYRDVLMNVVLPNGTIAEVQINVPAMMTAKESGHKLYEMQRRGDTPAERAAELDALQAQVYGEAFATAMASRSSNPANSSGVVSSPLANTSPGGAGLPDLANTSEPSASLSTGTPSTSNSLAPGGTSMGVMGSSLDGSIIANSELLEQAARVQRGPEQFPEVIIGLGLSETEAAMTAMEFMTGIPGDMAFLPPAVGGLSDVVEFLDERRKALKLAPLNINEEGDREQLARLMAAEALAAINSAGNALTWYDETIRNTLAMMALKFPELNSDPNARNSFLLAVAITSQGLNVEDNLKLATTVYEAFRRDGRFPETGSGESAGMMANNFKKANALMQEMGLDLFRQFLVTPFTAGELNAAGFKIDELADEEVLGSSVFGPKIGFGFYSNLTGNFEPVTIDMWFMRTVGRLAGTLPSYDPDKFSKQLEKLRVGLAERGNDGIYADQFDQSLVAQATSDQDAAVQLARQVKKAHERDFKVNRADYDAGRRKKSAIVRAAESMTISLDKPRDVPATGTERRNLRNVVRRMVEIVQEQYGQRIPPAALQALIWYPEQEFYKAMGVKLRVTNQDYAGAAHKVLTEGGISAEQLSTATQSGSGSARSRDGGDDVGAVQADGAGPLRASPLQDSERAALLDPRAQRVRENRERLKVKGQQVVFEVAPNPENTALSEEWNRLPHAQRLEISNRVLQDLLPGLMQELGIEGELASQVGSYIDDTNPSFTLRVTKGDAVTLAKVLGFGLSQQSMVVMSAKEAPGTEKTEAIHILLGDKTPQEVDEIYQRLRAIRIDGEQVVGGQSTTGGVMTVLNYSGKSSRVLASAIDEALGEQYDIAIHKLFSAFPEEKDYDYATSTRSDTGGDASLAGQRARDLRRRAEEALRTELNAVNTRAASGAGAVAATAGSGPRRGYHFSRTPRAVLDGRYHGSGLKGLERERLALSTDSRLRERVYFYIDEGAGITLESGVGDYAHEVDLPKLYNAAENAEGLWGSSDLNATEARLLDAGYAGYYVPNHSNGQGVAVVIGPDSRALVARPATAPGSTFQPQVAPQPYRRGLMSRELNALDLPAVQAVAPSARVNSGTFEVDRAELEAARATMAAQGIVLPEELNQDLGVLEQPNGREPFGTYDMSRMAIALGPSANLSTWLHESGHFFLDVMSRMASAPDAPAGVAQDWNTLLRWFGMSQEEWNADTEKFRTTGKVAPRMREAHEKFARSFEQYLFEGRAPSRDLQSAFRAFRSWLTSVYKSLQDFFAKNGEPGLNDEIRSVMDRMLATDQQIAEAQEIAGMVPDQNATDEAIEKLQARSLRDLKWAVNARSRFIQKLQSQVRDLRKTMREKVLAEVSEQPIYKAMKWLREDTKLGTEALAEMYMGEGDRYALLDWKPLTDKRLAGKGGIHPDVAADMFGFSSGNALVRALLEAEPLDSVVDAITSQRMLEEHGDLIDQRAIEQAATEAVHNEACA